MVNKVTRKKHYRPPVCSNLFIYVFDDDNLCLLRIVELFPARVVCLIVYAFGRLSGAEEGG